MGACGKGASMTLKAGPTNGLMMTPASQNIIQHFIKLVRACQYRLLVTTTIRVPATPLECFGVYAFEVIANIRLRVVVAQLDFNADNERHLLPTLVVGSAICDICFSTRQPLRVFKGELEDALDLAIGEGTPANRLATQIQKYLNDPRLECRRLGRYLVGTINAGRVFPVQNIIQHFIKLVRACQYRLFRTWRIS